MAHPQEDSKDHGYQADEHIRRNGHMFPFQAVNPHPGKGTQEDLGRNATRPDNAIIMGEPVSLAATKSARTGQQSFR